MTWIPIKERLPDPFQPVLVTDGKEVWSAKIEVIAGIGGWAPHGYDGWDVSLDFDEPTHWMPLPEPPAK